MAEAGEHEHTYTDDLLQLSWCKRLGAASLASQFCAIVTPLQVEAWAEALSGHPDQAFVKYLLDGICHGFRIGYNDDPSRMRRSAKRNMLSAKQNPQVVSDHLKGNERQVGLWGPYHQKS